MQSTPSHLCPETVWCSPHPHTYVLSQSDAVHTLTLMSWDSLMQYTPSHLCPESVWCSPHPHTYVLSQSDAVHTLTLMSWVSLMQSTPSHLCPETVWCNQDPHTLFSDTVFFPWSTRLPFTGGFRTNNFWPFVVFICVLHVQFISSSTY